MDIFITLTVLGLVGLIMMALPGFSHHAHFGGGHSVDGGDLPGIHGHVAGHLPAGHAVPGHVLSGHVAPGHIAPGQPATSQSAPGQPAPQLGSDSPPTPIAGVLMPAGPAGPPTVLGLAPSPRTIFSLMAVYGAFGHFLTTGSGWSVAVCAVASVVPAYLFERLVTTPLWNLMFRFEGKPSSSLNDLILREGVAVTPFSNGKGIITVERDGRTVQFSAHLIQAQSNIPVRPGDTLRIEDVDASRERVTVSIF